ncbi:hypothetical protein HBE96_13580 [Clostridium sp. P21]|uniref:Uncharacterized protein n=1 Tax=Clostridium muellerianum TaxID=2716538 RepID=A0A7Y0EJP7_9CLOT|nr:hypothetical protein [Clostridium muellerianum]NMM63685.1 hypothetical protein [Clostridium muellerianum]
MNLKKIIFALLIFTLPVTNAFEITEKISLPLFIGVICLMLCINKIKFYLHDIFFLLFIIAMMLTMIINGAINKRSILYLLSFAILCLVFLKVVSANYIYNKQLILRIMYFSTIVLSIYIIYEFTTRNFFPGLFFDLPRIMDKQYDATFIDKYYRARGFCTESGHTALFFEFILPFNIYYLYLNKSNIKKVIFLILVLASLVFINSSINFVIISVGSIFALLIYLMKGKNSVKKYLIVCLSVVLVISTLTLISNSGDLKLTINGMMDKISMTDNAGSSIERKMKMNKGYYVMSNNLIWGIGPMMLSNYVGFDSTLNMFIDLWLYSGIFGLISFYLFVLIFFIKIFKIKDNFKYCMLFSFFMVTFHYQIIANFYYPWLWILFGMIEGEDVLWKSKQIKSRINIH